MPQAYRGACPQVLGNKNLSAVIVVLAGTAAGSALAGNYADDLSRVYEAPQFIRAIKEACDKSHASSRAVNDAAYGAWRRRNKALLDELELRFTAMIRAASSNEQEYAKNVGKYAGAVVQNREELKEQFLAQGTEEIDRRCREFPQYLRSDEADLNKRYAEELKTIRKRKL
jgi:1,2-phenylacetyl-CoA epoxidase catalytic subunit